MIDVQTGYGGPAIHKTEDANPTPLIVQLVKQNPGAPRDVVERLFLEEIEGERTYQTTCAKYFFRNAWRDLIQQPRKFTLRGGVRKRADKREDVAKIKGRLKRAVISDMVMQNGKKVADCTGTEMKKFGGFFARVGEIVKRRKVGAVLTEGQLWKLWEERKCCKP